MSHQPGKIIDRRGNNKPGAPPPDFKPPTPFFAEDFIPARGYALIECRFIGASSTIHIPDAVHSQQQFAIVKAMGAGKLHYNGTVIPPEWEVGDFVYAAIAQGRRIELEDKKLVILGTEHIFGKFPIVPQAVIDEIKNEEEKERKAKEQGAPSGEPIPEVPPSGSVIPIN